jgi:hypothetical protein
MLKKGLDILFRLFLFYQEFVRFGKQNTNTMLEKNTLQSLLKTIEFLGLDRDGIVSLIKSSINIVEEHEAESLSLNSPLTKEDRLQILEIYSRVYLHWDSTLSDLEEYVKSGKTKTHENASNNQ